MAVRPPDPGGIDPCTLPSWTFSPFPSSHPLPSHPQLFLQASPYPNPNTPLTAPLNAAHLLHANPIPNAASNQCAHASIQSANPTTSSPANPTSQTVNPKPTFASLVAQPKSVQCLNPRLAPILKDVPLQPQKPMTLNKRPAIHITPDEDELVAVGFNHTLIMKFSVSRPTLQEIRTHITSHWQLRGSFQIGLLDPRHVMVYMQTHEDKVIALSRESRMLNSTYYRLFQWTPDFAFRKDSCVIPVWLQLKHLPLHYFTPSVLHRIGSGLGTFLRADDRTMTLSHPSCARICVEMDISQPLPDSIWIGRNNDEGFWQPIKYEGNLTYCPKCCLIGHSYAQCNKRRDTSHAPVVDTVSQALKEQPNASSKGEKVVRGQGSSVQPKGVHAHTQKVSMGGEGQWRKVGKPKDKGASSSHSAKEKEVIDVVASPQTDNVIDTPNPFAVLNEEGHDTEPVGDSTYGAERMPRDPHIGGGHSGTSSSDPLVDDVLRTHSPEVLGTSPVSLLAEELMVDKPWVRNCEDSLEVIRKRMDRIKHQAPAPVHEQSKSAREGHPEEGEIDAPKDKTDLDLLAGLDLYTPRGDAYDAYESDSKLNQFHSHFQRLHQKAKKKEKSRSASRKQQ